MQNLLTIVSILQEDYKNFAMEMNNTEAKKAQEKVLKLKSPTNLLKTIGVIHLLEQYSAASLEG